MTPARMRLMQMFDSGGCIPEWRLSGQQRRTARALVQQGYLERYYCQTTFRMLYCLTLRGEWCLRAARCSDGGSNEHPDPLDGSE
jgi:hypothetical protein